jgi:hypothetical protein
MTDIGQSRAFDEATTGLMQLHAGFGRLTISGRLNFIAKERSLDFVIYGVGILSALWFFATGGRLVFAELIVTTAEAQTTGGFIGFPNERYFAMTAVFLLFVFCLIGMCTLPGPAADRCQSVAKALVGALVTRVWVDNQQGGPDQRSDIWARCRTAEVTEPRAVAVWKTGACGRLQHHSATAKQYCPPWSTVARHFSGKPGRSRSPSRQ